MTSITTLKIHKKPNGFDTKKFIEEFRNTYESKSGFTEKKTFSPSTLGYGHGNCARYWFIAFNGAEFEDTATPQAKAAMENGSFVHDRIQSRMSKMNNSYKIISHEIDTVHQDPPIHGYMDSLVHDIENDLMIPFEIKSAKDEQYHVKQYDLEPSANHKIQLLTYMKVWGYEQGVFVYENKNDQSLLLINISMDEDNTKLIDYVFDWLRGVYDLYLAETLPNRAFTKSTWACKGCPVKKVCWKDMKENEGEVQYPAMVTKL
jgi:CRISPR/Cas system-associated exonuclease Cas4 (RecB family)